jgi:hypothetical protein
MRPFYLPLLSLLLLSGLQAPARQILTNETSGPVKVLAHRVRVYGGALSVSLVAPGQQGGAATAWAPGSERKDKCAPGPSFEGLYDRDQEFSNLNFLLPPGGSLVFSATRREGFLAPQMSFLFKVAKDGPEAEAEGKSEKQEYWMSFGATGEPNSPLQEQIRHSIHMNKAKDPAGFSFEGPDPNAQGTPTSRLKDPVVADSCCIIL